MKTLWLTILMALFFSFVLNAESRELPYFEDKQLTPYWKTDGSDYSPAVVKAFKAIDQNNNTITHNELKNHVSLVNFFFVSCPGICPMMMKNVKRLQAALGNQKENVHIFSFSVQPEIDTPKMLINYANSYHIDLKNWTLLTGEKKEIYRVGKEMFKADGAVGDQKNSENFIHTQNIYMVDGELNIRGIYNTSDTKDMNQLAEDIAILNKSNKISRLTQSILRGK